MPASHPPLIRSLAVLGLLLLTGALARAQGGGGGGGLTGMVYYSHLGGIWTMNSDGSGKTALPSGVSGEPSRALHGGRRWFLQVRDIPGETYPGLAQWNTRREIFAVRDDANVAYTVQLTTQADLETNANVRWLPGDSQISFIARRWVGTQVLEGGVYTASVLFDGLENVTGLAAQPVSPAVPVGLVVWSGNNASGTYFQNDLGPDLWEHDWAPGGTQLLYNRFSAEQIWVATVGGAQGMVLSSAWIRTPAWSTDGSKIAFRSSDSGSFGGLYTITPTGTNLKRIAKDGTSWSVSTPRWSPSGGHMVYARFNNLGFPTDYYDIYRTGATGTGTANLTGSVPTAYPIAWR